MTRRKRMLEQLEEEIREHLERETQDNIDRGMSPEAARYAAMRKFGNVTRVKEQTHDVWGATWLEQFLQDMRFGVRTLGRSPSVTIAAILAIALGVGINVGIFSVINGLALRLLPVPRAREVLSISQILQFHGQGNRDIRNNEGYVSWPEYRDYRDHNHVFSGVAAYEPEAQATLRSIGVYGMVSFSVGRSMREIGIRLALGADKRTVVWHVLWQATKPVLVGGAVGVILCGLVSNLLASMMFGIGAHDPVAFVIVPCFLFAVASLAAFLPARRAAEVDPAVTLRCE